MSPPVLGPEALAITSNLLRKPLSCRELLPLQPSPTCARHLGLLVLLTGANQHRVIPPASYGGVYDIYPRTQSAVTLYRGGSRGEGCQPPYFIRSSILTYYRHSPQGVSFLTFYYIASLTNSHRNVKSIRIFF